MTPINIAFCINDNYVEQLIVVLWSIMKNLTTGRDVNVWIVSSDMSDASKNYLRKLRLGFKNLYLNFLDIDAKELAQLPRTIDYISAETYYRYLLPNLLPNVDKILYMDADIVVNGDISPLYDTDLANCYIAGADDSYIAAINHKPQIGLDNSELYVNAGVLLMNLKQMRTDNIPQKLIDTTKNMASKVKYQDQDIINIVCRGKILEFDSIYNYTSHNILKEKSKYKHAVVIHYTGKNKPWMSTCRNPMRKMWRQYARRAKKMVTRKIHVALLIDEFFGGAGTVFGGYGALARKYIAKYIPNDDIEMDVLLGAGGHRFRPRKYHVDNVNLYRLPRRHWASRRFLRRKNYNIYLSIELTTDWVLRHEPDTTKKLILWIQDPRPKYEWDEIETMTLMPEPNYYNQNIYDLVNELYHDGRVRFVSQGYFLNQKAIDLYKLDPDVEIQYMPNPVELDSEFNVEKYKKKNMIIFLGRLEDVKRGWLFCEMAKRVPEYDFYVLGKTNETKTKTAKFWDKYKSIPNLHFAGHVDGDVKNQFLKDAKILVNTSIHEALPVSFLEALSYGCTLVSNRNPDSLTEKFGIWIGDVLGNGFESIDLYADAVRKLMTDDKLRSKLAQAGRKYVEQVHNIPRFVRDMRNVIYQEL